MMANTIFLELLALSVFVLYMFFSYCDGFRLHPARKILWALWFCYLSFTSYNSVGHFDLTFIILFSCPLSFVFAWLQRNEK